MLLSSWREGRGWRVADLEWVDLTSKQQLATAIFDQDNYLVHFNDCVMPLAFYYGMMVGDHPVLWAAVERGIPVQLAHSVPAPEG